MTIISGDWYDPGNVSKVKNVAYFDEIDRARISDVGGKGANLGELTRAGFPVPVGFCITTRAYATFIRTSGEMGELFGLLEKIKDDDLERIRALGHRIREHLRSLPVPEEIRSDILEAWRRTGEGKAYAVRSSATAEDLPTASFAGQQDTYLNVRGPEQLLRAVQSCWASLFTDRAIAYRTKNGFGHRSVLLSVVVQQMVFPEVSGIMFTADPVSGHRKTVAIDASFGLGEALVSGLVTADLYQVRSGAIIKKQISAKKIAIYASPDGGTVKQDLPPDKQGAQALSDDPIVELAALGEKIEAHYGSPQDIEWCLAEGKFYVVQSRPITSLYPVPGVADGRLHVFISFGHVQMMTEAMKPLGISFWRTLQGAWADRAEGGVICEAGGRLYIDPTPILAFRPARKALLRALGFAVDESFAAALSDVAERDDFQRSTRGRGQRIPLRTLATVFRVVTLIVGNVALNLLVRDPVRGRSNIQSTVDRLLAGYEREVVGARGPDRIRVIRDRTVERMITLLPKLVPYIGAPVLASMLIRKILGRQLDDPRVGGLVDQLNQSLPGSITTELGLAVGDLAEVARQHPAVADYLTRARDGTFYEELRQADGGPLFLAELERFMGKFGMRGSGEIDITRTRWKESPALLAPLITSHIRSTAPGEYRRKYEEGKAKAEEAAGQILALARKGRLGFIRAKALSRLIGVYRNYMGLREYPKHVIMRYLDACKRCLLEDANTLVAKGVLQGEHDAYYLSLSELLELEDGRFSGDIQVLVEARKKQYEQDKKLSPPRVMTSEGEVITGMRRGVVAPEGALTGTPASAGVVEGIARVVLRLEEANLHPGEILVAPYTDPGWTPLFSSAKGLVTEVGGMMTHGSVVAREYGIPAVVGVEKATQIIKDGYRIRVDGTKGYVQVLKESDHG